MFSKSCEYAIKAGIYIAHKSALGEMAGLKEIAQATNSPEAFMAKILQQLVKSGVLESQKGRNGGFSIANKSSDEIKLIRLVEAIDGDQLFVGCGLGLKECSEKNPCPLHSRFMEVRDGIRQMLEKTDLMALSEDFKLGETFLN